MPKVIKQWLSQQAIWQVHLSPLKHVNRPHYEVTIPSEVHQFDLLYMASAALYGDKYKYILSGIDVTSRYKGARPMRMKQAKDVANMIADIYKVGSLTKIFQCDNKSKLKAKVTKMLRKCGVMIKHKMTKYKHMHMASVEALNKLLTENLFKVQDVKELNDPEKVSLAWVKHLYGLIDRLNDTKTQMIGMSPSDVIEIAEVPLIESYPQEDKLPEDGFYHYLLQPDEEHDDQCKRAMDRMWSKELTD